MINQGVIEGWFSYLKFSHIFNDCVRIGRGWGIKLKR